MLSALFEILLWGTFIGIFYSYLGYPLLLYILSRLRVRSIDKESAFNFPQISIVIAARNEASRIRSRLTNLLEQDYPDDLVEIIVVSDGSDDDTVAVVAQVAEENCQSFSGLISCIALPAPVGKPTCLNAGVAQACGEILVFADCRQRFAPDTVRRLVENFADEQIGCVSGKLVFVESPDSAIQVEMGTYWNYELQVRRLESLSGSMVGVTGAVHAMRKKLYRQIPAETLLDDLFSPIHCYLQGKRVVLEEKALAYDYVTADVGGEWKRKVRTLAGNWQLFSLIPELRNPFTFGLGWRWYSHKVSRLLVPFLLPVLLVSSCLNDGWFVSSLLLGQIVAYSSAAMGWIFPQTRSVKLVGLCYFFFVLNWAAFTGWIVWMRGDLSSCWGTTSRNDG